MQISSGIKKARIYAHIKRADGTIEKFGMVDSSIKWEKKIIRFCEWQNKWVDKTIIYIFIKTNWNLKKFSNKLKFKYYGIG